MVVRLPRRAPRSRTAGLDSPVCLSLKPAPRHQNGCRFFDVTESDMDRQLTLLQKCSKRILKPDLGSG
jgi:hypothetical protein